MSVVGDVDGMDSLLFGGVTDQMDACFTGLRLHFTGYCPLAGTQLVTTHTDTHTHLIQVWLFNIFTQKEQTLHLINVGSYSDTREVLQFYAVKNGSIPYFIDILFVEDV